MSLSGICQDCHENPATYGDGVTWERCSACQRKAFADKPEAQEPDLPKYTMEHKRIPGLISIVIPIHNLNYALFHMTGNCIGSIREHTDKEKTPYEIIIVDNGSPVQPPTLDAYYADKVIRWEENKGVTKAWNAGIRVSFGEYIVLLNNDTLVYDGWLEDLKDYLDHDYSMVMGRPMYSLSDPFARAIEAKKAREGNMKFDKIPGGRDFSCVMFRKDLFEKLGGEMFDEQFFNYYSDLDLYNRLDDAHLMYGIHPNVYIHHISNGTSYYFKDRTSKIMNEDKEKYDQKYKDWQPSGEAKNNVEAHVEKDGSSQAVAPRFVRTNFTGDTIFMVKDGKTHPIADPETYHALGGDFGDEGNIEREEFNKYSMGERINMSNIEKYA